MRRSVTHRGKIHRTRTSVRYKMQAAPPRLGVAIRQTGDRIIVDGCIAGGERFGAKRLRERSRRIEIGIDNVPQPGLRMPGDVWGVNFANPASPKETKIEHRFRSLNVKAQTKKH